MEIPFTARKFFKIAVDKIYNYMKLTVQNTIYGNNFVESPDPNKNGVYPKLLKVLEANDCNYEQREPFLLRKGRWPCTPIGEGRALRNGGKIQFKPDNTATKIYRGIFICKTKWCDI